MEVINKTLDTRISDIMSTNLKTAAPNDDLVKVKELLNNNNIHHIPITENDKLLGILSKTDFLAFIQKGEDNTDFLQAHRAKEIMTTKVVKTTPDERVAVAVLILLENFFHCVPVVNDDDNLVGIITPYDVMKLCYNSEYTNHPFQSMFH